ncbi:hypothetical protein NDU88_006218 [Pleurodeles waltl]|uniref:Uncharacterized protein n=1 Tax=Pleurodeles waltl TaxID=8319 RepID=A0AAV7X333_PLEWA|nr:hypothetical protein NDU88_006218 [Pleurodeles waltl]
MGAAGGHPPYHCHAVPPRANNVSPPFSGVPWVLSTDSLVGRPEVVPLAQGPSSWAGAALPPPIRGTSRPRRSPSAPGASSVRRVTAEPPRRSSLCGHPGAALSVQGLSPEPTPSPQSAGFRAWGAVPLLSRTPGILQGRLFRPRGSTREARPSALQGPRSAPSPAPRRQEGQQRRSRISHGDPVPAAILFFFPLGAGRAAAADRSLPFATAHLHRLLGIQGSRGESKRHPSLGKTALAMGG